MEVSKSVPTQRSRDEAGPSGSSYSFVSPFQQVVPESKQSQIERATALSSVEHIQDTLAKLQSNFTLPANYTPHADNREETTSVPPVSTSNLTECISFTSTNKLVYR